MAWVQDFSQGSVRAIGLAEVLGARGLILPQTTGIAPILTPLAALGLAALQIGAIITHVRRHETKALPVNVALLVLALVVAIRSLRHRIGRTGKPKHCLADHRQG